MDQNDPNVELLTLMAQALGELRDQFVFVGGCATALLVTDPAAPRARPTQDVDAVVGAVSLPDYHRIGQALRGRGFTQTVEGGEPPYRWTHAGMKLDVMPVSGAVLGFTNPWYEPAMRDARPFELAPGVAIRLVTAPHFIATKLVAFQDRGRGDYLESHDLEDVLSVVDGRPELVDEFARADPDLRAYVSGIFQGLLANDGFLNALPGIIIEGGPAGRVPVVIARMQAIATEG